jgi:hypothetical protein
MDGVSDVRSRTVAVIRGRDDFAFEAMSKFLRSNFLIPREFQEAVALTRKGAPLVMETVRALLRDVQAVIVLLTPDDMAIVHPDVGRPYDRAEEKRYRGQARQNVLIETGMSLMLRPKKTIIVRLGDVRLASDLNGIDYVQLDESPQMVTRLSSRIKVAGCPIDVSAPSAATFPDYDEVVAAVRSRERELYAGQRPDVTLHEAAIAAGLVDVESRTDAGLRALPPVDFYMRAHREVMMSALTAAQTFHQHDREVDQLLTRGVALRFLLLHPDSPDWESIADREDRPVKNDLATVLELIRRKAYHRRGDFKVRFATKPPPFTGIMLDGHAESEADGPFLAEAELRIQPWTAFGTAHNGMIMQLRNAGPLSPFEYFAIDLRRQWATAEPM